MIQLQTILNVSDNSGAKTAKCIKVFGGFKKKTANIGDIVLVSIQKLRNKIKLKSKVKKGEVYKAIVIRVKNKTLQKNGVSFKYFENSVSILNKQSIPLATRIKGPVQKILKTNPKIVSISDGLI